MRPDSLLIATGATINSHQLALLHIKLLILVHHPLVMAVSAQRLALVFSFRLWFTKLQYVGQKALLFMSHARYSVNSIILARLLLSLVAGQSSFPSG